jgi:hypothetical protein
MTNGDAIDLRGTRPSANAASIPSAAPSHARLRSFARDAHISRRARMQERENDMSGTVKRPASAVPLLAGRAH